jgi:leader peptidase (prepilin peptidase) / N-methyltransferase
MALEFLAGNLPAMAFIGLLLGLLIGSFLNVVVYRLPLMLERDWKAQAREILDLASEPAQATFNLILPNSQCPNCGHEIRHKCSLPLG